jgi:hypothetical protein
MAGPLLCVGRSATKGIAFEQGTAGRAWARASAEAPCLIVHEPEPFAAYAFFERNVLAAFSMRSP